MTTIFSLLFIIFANFIANNHSFIRQTTIIPFAHNPRKTSLPHCIKNNNHNNGNKWGKETSATMMMSLDSAASSYLPFVGSALVVAGVVAFHEAGHFLAARWQGIKVTSYNIGYGPKLFSFNDTKDDVEFSLRAIPLGGYVAFPQDLIFDKEGNVVGEIEDPDLLQNRPPIQRALVISAGVLANVLLALVLSIGTASTVGIDMPTYRDGVVVTELSSPTSPGSMAGLKVNDVILKVKNQVLASASAPIDTFISAVRTSKDKPLQLEVLRNKAVVSVTVIPRGVDGGRATIGIGINKNIEKVNNIKASNPIQAIQLGFDETIRIITFTISSFQRAFSTGFSGNDVGGPIAVVKAGAQMAEYSSFALVNFAAMLSINLAVINAFPFPALDGGQFAFVALEILTGKAIKREIRDFITGVAFIFLLTAGAGTLLGDIDKQWGEPIELILNQSMKK